MENISGFDLGTNSTGRAAAEHDFDCKNGMIFGAGNSVTPVNRDIVGLSKSVETESLKEKYLLLKGEYAKLLTDRDCLLEWGKPQPEALYVVKIGRKQLELLELSMDVKRLKKICRFPAMKFCRWSASLQALRTWKTCTK
jgi:hypothetical protein